MVYLLAHHAGHLLESVDVLGLRPESMLDHVLAFGAYGLLLSALAGACIGTRALVRRRRGIRRRDVGIRST